MPLRTSEANLRRLAQARAECGESVLVPADIVDDIVDDLLEAHRMQRELDEACERLERRPITLARRSA